LAISALILLIISYYLGLPNVAKELSLSLFIVGSGLVVLRLLEILIVNTLPEEVNPHSIANIIKIFGYLFIALIALSILELNFAILGGTVMGIILGFAAQPTLGNLFAGLLVLLSRALTPGERVIIASKEIPIQITPWPAYKFFSRDYVFPGYEVYVKEIGLFFTKVVTTNGIEIVLPNSVLIKSIIIKQPVEKKINIRLEVPIEKVRDALQRINELSNKLHKMKVLGVYIEEQSDKNYIIIKVEGKAINPYEARSEFYEKILDAIK